MRVTMEKAMCESCLKLAAGVRSTMAHQAGWLRSVRIRARKLTAAGGAVSFDATDAATAISIWRTTAQGVDTQVEDAGEVYVYPERVLAALKTLPDGDDDEPALVTLETDDEGEEPRLLLRGDSSAWWEFLGLTEDEMVMPDIGAPEEGGLLIGALTLERTLQQTSYARAHEKGRYALNGVLLEAMEQRKKGGASHIFRMSAADGARLARAWSEFNSEDEVEFGPVIVPPEPLGLVLDGMHESSSVVRGNVRLHYADATGTLYVTADGCTVSTQAIEGSFPDVDSVLPSGGFRADVICEPVDLVRALRQASVTAGERESNAIEWTVGGGNGQALFSEMSGVGQSHAEFPGVHQGDEVTLRFAYPYLLDVARRADGEDVRIYITDARTPIRIEPGVGVECVISPIVPTDDEAGEEE